MSDVHLSNKLLELNMSITHICAKTKVRNRFKTLQLQLLVPAEAGATWNLHESLMYLWHSHPLGAAQPFVVPVAEEENDLGFVAKMVQLTKENPGNIAFIHII